MESLEGTREILRRLPLFSRLSDSSLEAVARRTVIRRVPQTTTLFREGEPCEGLYVVLEGAIRIYRANRAGREQVLHVQGPGQPIAEVPLFDGGPYPASARAVEESRVLFLPRNEFEWLYQNNPEIAGTVIRELGRRLRRMVRLIEKISLKSVPARVAMTLLEYGERVGSPRDGLEFELPRTQEDLASELATTRESVARALAGLRRTGAIETRGSRVRIRDLAKLESAAFAEADAR
jgi:CRP/FNR family transcriptional regulator, cyclic AMP receptor protein